MCQNNLAVRLFTQMLIVACVGGAATVARAQTPSALGPELHFKVEQSSQRLEMIVNTSRILTLDKKIPRIQVNNPEIAKAQPLATNKIQLVASRPGVTQVNLWDENDKIYTVDVLVFGDARELQMVLEAEFPNSALKVRPLASSVVLSGFVDRPEDVSRVVRMAEDYYPKIINNITVGGVQQVLLHVKVMEVSRTKLREMGIDWAAVHGNDFVVSRASNILGAPDLDVGDGISGALTAASDTLRFGVVNGQTAFFGFLEALRQYNMAKLLAEPTLVTVSGRPASFNVGGEFPILVPGGLGTVSIEYKQFGTRVDFVPIVLGNGNIRLEVRPSVTERDDASGVNGVPAIRTRWVDTAAEMKAGQTMALAGLIQNRVEAENRGVPVLADLPWAGAMFRRVEHNVNEVELLILITPELVGAMDPHEVPQCLPGQFTTNPSDCELYGRGYLEVPKCCDGQSLDCASCGNGVTYASPAMQGHLHSSVQHSSPSRMTSTTQQHGTMRTPQIAPTAQPSYGRTPATAVSSGGQTFRRQPLPQSSDVDTQDPAASASVGDMPQGLFGPIGYDELD